MPRYALTAHGRTWHIDDRPREGYRVRFPLGPAPHVNGTTYAEREVVFVARDGRWVLEEQHDGA